MNPLVAHLERESLLRTTPNLDPADSLRRGEEMALETFHFAARTVPAYSRFLAGHGLDPARIQSAADLRSVPPTTKENYLELHPLDDLVPGGDLTRADIFHTSSGTMGKSYFWPCSVAELAEGAELYEMVFERTFQVSRRRTLVIICFGMGTWIAGSFTTFAAALIKQRGYSFSVVTPGFNKDEALHIIRRLGALYQQVIVVGIPTFVKDLFEAIHVDPELSRLSYGCIFSGEGFSEAWRSYLMGLLNGSDPYRSTASVYGSADAALKAFESPETIGLRRHLADSPALCQSLFGQERVPAIFHFVPWVRHFESHEGELLVTARRGIPLVRYNLHDQGGILPIDRWQSLSADLPEAARSVLPLPVVYVFGRGKFAATLYGVNIFADNVRDALLTEELRGRITGKFILETCYDERQSQYLRLRVELSGRELAGDLPALIAGRVTQYLARVSSEYRRMSLEKGSLASPLVTVHPFGDPDYFPEGRIQKSS